MGDISVHSPATDLTSGFNVSGGSRPAAPSVYPDVQMTDKGASDAAVGNKPAESFVGMSESPGAAQGVQLADVPELPSADLGPEFGGGIGERAWKPSGSY